MPTKSPAASGKSAALSAKPLRAMPARVDVDTWFAGRGWSPFPFQREVWAAYAEGKSGLLHAPTGLGKTLAVWLGPLIEHSPPAATSPIPLTVLWITPLRALAADTLRALAEPVEAMGLPWSLGRRTGDSTAKERRVLKERLPSCLVITPESLSLLLSYPETREKFTHLRAVVVDEWHELLGNKRGVQTELCLARLRAWQPGLRVWGLSATLGNLGEAKEVLCPRDPDAMLVEGKAEKKMVLETLIPEEMESFPWAGHLGTKMVEPVVRAIESAGTTLVFTNTRAQTEIWYQSLLAARPDWKDDLAMHHGSLERAERKETEERLASGTVRAVVCTSSLDLGVDFSPVDQVIQIGSPKGIARLLQRAGRSGHQPGAVSRLVGVPTHAFELVEFAAAREAMSARRVEPRSPLLKPLDLLVQHLQTIALGGGFKKDEMRAEIMSTHAFAAVQDDEWAWAMAFITCGGHVLSAYPQFRKVAADEDGVFHMRDSAMARLHRMSIGTIVSDAAVAVKFTGGRTLGTIEEWFVGRLRPGSVFVFAGRKLELVRHHGTTVYVRPATGKAQGEVPSWQGGKMPLSTTLAAGVAEAIRRAPTPDDPPELKALAPLLAKQREHSVVPEQDEILIEQTRTREGWHVYWYPFAGRLAHEGLSTLLAWRMARKAPKSIHMAVNDYGFELQCPEDIHHTAEHWRELCSPDGLLEDLCACMNTTELARHQFREIARVAGLVLQTVPSARKSTRALQASSGLLYDTFARYDPENLLLEQARREILERQLEFTRLHATMRDLAGRRFHVQECPRLSPLAFPLWAERLSSRLSTEDFETRLRKMLGTLG